MTSHKSAIEWSKALQKHGVPALESREDATEIAQHLLDMSGLIDATSRECVPISTTGNEVFIDGPGMVSLDHGDARLKRAEAAEAEVERLRKWCSTAARNYDDMLNAINAVVGGEFETAFHRTAKSLRDASQFMKLAAEGRADGTLYDDELSIALRRAREAEGEASDMAANVAAHNAGIELRPTPVSGWDAGVEDAAKVVDQYRENYCREWEGYISDEAQEHIREFDKLAEGIRAIKSTALRDQTPEREAGEEFHKLDNSRQVFFYEQDFYVLSNFSAFSLRWSGRRFDTSEAAYHWEKFIGHDYVMEQIASAPSAHEAFKLAERNRHLRRPDWDDVKVQIMRRILHEKASQHEYVRRKLLATGDRELIEDSWRDDFWGWGPNRDGENMLGKLWMEVRAGLVAKERK